LIVDTGGGGVGEMLAEFRRRNRIPQDDGERAWWTCRLGPISILLPNFRWRRHAVLAHDLHHLLTGYPCTMRGECQTAAWEFGAGAMPHWAARLFCLPLVLLGLLWSPRRTWDAFASGRQSRTLHCTRVDQRMLTAPLDELRGIVQGSARPESLYRAGFLFAALVLEATAIVSIPVAAAAGLCFAFWA
jgi:hypothetical protein